jgi:Holliday junction resolvasome RuvABC endonuclease subunit
LIYQFLVLGVVIEELDDEYNIQSIEYHGFTSKRKLESSQILYYNNKDYNTDYAKYQWICDNIVNWCKDCEYIAVEDYAYGKSGAMGLIFNLAEFEGNVKISLFNAGKNLRTYSINQIKKFFTAFGLSDKISMYQAWEKLTTTKPDLSCLPEVDNGKGVSPTSDIVDAFAICEYLRTELTLRAGIIQLKDLPKHKIECFNAITKEHPQGLLVGDFIHK